MTYCNIWKEIRTYFPFKYISNQYWYWDMFKITLLIYRFWFSMLLLKRNTPYICSTYSIFNIHFNLRCIFAYQKTNIQNLTSNFWEMLAMNCCLIGHGSRGSTSLSCISVIHSVPSTDAKVMILWDVANGDLSISLSSNTYFCYTWTKFQVYYYE